MSGGHFSFSYIHVQGDLDEIAHDPRVAERWPRLAQALANLGQRLSMVIRDVDYDLSGDTHIEHDGPFEALSLRQLVQALDEVLPESGT